MFPDYIAYSAHPDVEMLFDRKMGYARIGTHIKHVLIRCVRSAYRGFITSMKVTVSSLLRRHNIGSRARMQPYLV